MEGDLRLLSPLDLFRLQPSSMADDIAAELGQTKVRFGILVVMLFYVGGVGLYAAEGWPLPRWAIIVLVYFGFFGPLAAFFYVLARRYPGHYPARRLATMLLDFGSLAFSIVMNVDWMLPVYCLIVWVTVGNGMRFGRPYLYVGAVMGQLCLAAMVLLTPIWQTLPVVCVTLSLTVFVVPFYASALLDRIEQARLATEEASLAKSRFLAQASHDLRQPVHAIGLFILSLKQTGLSKPQISIVERIDRSLQGVASLFRSLLDVSTLDSGALEPNMRPVALKTLLDDLVSQNAKAAEWAGVDLRYVPTRRVVIADPALLMTMVQNLLSNSFKYAADRPVLIGCRIKGSTLSVQVIDQGAGIADHHLPHLFDEFYQVRERGDPDRQGVGLGLSIVKRLSSLMKLDVAIRSRPGKGTSVAIGGLRIWQGKIADVLPDIAVAPLAPLRGMRILIVEDDLDVLAATRELLIQWECIVTARSTIPDTAFDCDLIITDYDLGGGKTGGDCIASVRERSGRHIPAIVITGHDKIRVSTELDDTTIPIIHKPVSPAELRSSIGAMRTRLQQQKDLGLS